MLKIRVIFTILLLLATHHLRASCGSSAFNSWNTLRTAYPTGADARLTNSNWVDDKIYTHADGIFGKIHQLVQTAEKHVYLQTWTFQPKTKPALYLADAIRKLAARRASQRKQGTVHIWLLLNILSLQNEEQQQRKIDRYIEEQGLNLAGIEIHVAFFKAKLLGANHVKTVSVDNKVALVTGANFSVSNNGLGFFDLGFVLKGDVLKSLDYDFVQTWISFVKSGPNPTDWGAHLNGSSRHCYPTLFTRNRAFPNITNSIQKSSMNDAIIESIQGAQSNIEIITPNMNVTKLLDALAKAALRGVNIRIILSKGFTDFAQELPTRGGANARSISRIYQGLSNYLSPAEICQRLQINWYSHDGRSITETTKPPASHAKFMLIDKKIAFFGSANMDNQSWVNSREISLFVDKPSLARQWTLHFFDPIFKRSFPIDRCAD